jgi:hypothetical protein
LQRPRTGAAISSSWIARMQRTIRSCAWQCDKQGTDVHKSAGVGYSVRIATFT